jgi:hypothetical protein
MGNAAEGEPGRGLFPQGRYRLTHTINIWPSIRPIGYGAQRPVFIFAANTPGYADANPARLRGKRWPYLFIAARTSLYSVKCDSRK